ncbi:uncharacterized protein HMPREF1541_09426 [Cyphellophora europaea CBS 101466]|uniref:Transcription factor domain-containing protein n=1 Tax=Cyphellophora europaea (strain CBS 101466) TaxID=1220924 RepID=W2SCD8_CYPE1|nr:uncharacterized protein HMPREF1541_09426 [Cyphellophora europaea CBS 101466]ETN45594.1 hypothetical protein HMPREF1541_09426 [Cyphellophora europaea CBS 101466]
MPPNQFLFINKDPTSKSLSNNRTENSLAYSKINKHVQRLSARQRLQHKARVPNSVAQSLVGWQSLIPLTPESSEDQSPYTPRTGSVSSVSEGEEDTVAAEDDVEEVPRPRAVEPGNSTWLQPANRSSWRPAVDSLPSSVVKLDASGHRVLQYYLQVWMPSASHIPVGCQIAGFTPIWPNDLLLASQVMEGAMQTDDPLSMHSLLAAGSRRMQSLHRQRFDQPGLPELHTLKAVQALRKRAETSGPLNERLILDISYLILADLYAEIPSRSEIYYQISRDLIARFGGLQNLDPFTTQAALAYDYFHSIGTLTMPALDPLHDTALLGIDSSTMSAEKAKELAQNQVANLEPRMRMTALVKHDFARVLREIQTLPPAVVGDLKDMMTHHVPQLYPVLAGPFVQNEGEQPAASQSASNALHLMEADTLSIQTRNALCHAWLWYSAMGCVGIIKSSMEDLDPWAEAHQTYQPPAHIGQASGAWQQLSRIEELLKGTGWQVKPLLSLWLYAVGYLLATTLEDRNAYGVRFQWEVRALHIIDLDGLRRGLASHLPLHRIAPDWLLLLGALLPRDDGG